jgi:hypothetical protein
VPTPENEKFEQYLKKFRPLIPEPMPVSLMSAKKVAPGIKGGLALGAWASIVAAVIVLAIIFLPHRRPQPQLSSNERKTKVIPRFDQIEVPQSLTIGAANALLARAPSAKEAVDGLADRAFQSQPIAFSEGMQSALALLSMEKIKL